MVKYANMIASDRCFIVHNKIVLNELYFLRKLSYLHTYYCIKHMKKIGPVNIKQVPSHFKPSNKNNLKVHQQWKSVHKYC